MTDDRRGEWWRWACRTCGAKDSHPGAQYRDEAAMVHLIDAPNGPHVHGPKVETAEVGHLLHVWTWGP